MVPLPICCCCGHLAALGPNMPFPPRLPWVIMCPNCEGHVRMRLDSKDGSLEGTTTVITSVPGHIQFASFVVSMGTGTFLLACTF
jgi:hypothetical protein